ncbi:hypothetical protein BG003_007958, partial [Podila horticola]
VAFVLAIEPGTYLIQDFTGRSLATGPPDAPVRLSERGDRWEVKAQDGGLVISTRSQFGQLSVVIRDGIVFASAQKKPELLSVNSAGDGRQVIKLPNSDDLFTSVPFDALVRLQRAEGQIGQLWTFIPIDRELYHRNRFCQQESW